ncbi:MAG: hypothetical protein JXM73_26600 [Anaerolineae bacterium]|nr:hypothetical protein [Anaerolineae bacterium]
MDKLTLGPELVSVEVWRPLLARLGRRLRLRDAWLLAQRTLWMGCLGMALVQAAGRIWPIAHLALWTLLPLPAWLLAVVGLSLLRPLPPGRVARRIDTELALKERLSTAWALSMPVDRQAPSHVDERGVPNL